jgi:hypothetical protein
LLSKSFCASGDASAWCRFDVLHIAAGAQVFEQTAEGRRLKRRARGFAYLSHRHFPSQTNRRRRSRNGASHG